MDVTHHIRDLMTDKDIKVKTLAGHLKIGSSTLSNYIHGTRTMPYDILIQIADYFHVTTDYLLGRTDVPDIPLRLSEGERKLILDLRSLNPDQKAVAAQNIQFMASQNRR